MSSLPDKNSILKTVSSKHELQTLNFKVPTIYKAMEEYAKAYAPVPELSYPDKLFERYVVDARNEFVKIIVKHFPHIGAEHGRITEEGIELRTACEDILIAYDQMKEKLAAPVPGKEESYWQRRCEAAEYLLNGVDNNINKRFVGYKEWQTLKEQEPASPSTASNEDKAERAAKEYGEWQLCPKYHDDGSYDTFLRSEAWKSIQEYITGASFNKDAVEFAEWASHSDWTYLPSKKLWYNEEDEENITPKTTQELYNLFKQIGQ